MKGGEKADSKKDSFCELGRFPLFKKIKTFKTNDMNKIKTGIITAMCMLGIVALTAYNQTKDAKSNGILLANVEAMANPEFPPGWYPNFVMGTVWYNSSWEIQFTPPFFSSGWSSMKCCINSSDSNACNFNNEDSDCEAHVVRNARS